MLEAFSPKLERRVRFFNRATFNQWLRLEADPAVHALCERPLRLGSERDARVADFWVRRDDAEALQLVDYGDGSGLDASTRIESFDGLPLQHISAVELAAASMWVANWRRMLPVINATRSLRSKSLTQSVLRLVREPMALARVERDLAMGDPPIVRGAVFELLRTGRLRAPALHTEALSLHTLLEPAT
ncbi:MAG: hypothetical protein L6Q69_20675 [Zoogloea sp.]|nr:hypothetical protein [Zoogloea sp.]